MKRVLGIIRLSRENDMSTSPERQREIIETFCKLKGWKVVEWAIDLGVSASVPPKERRSLGPWLTDPVKMSDYDCIVSWRLDRVSRRAKHFLDFIEWCDENKKVYASATEPINLDDQMGRMFAMLLAMLAEGELQAIKERTKGTFDHLVREGKHRGGLIAYGYMPVKHEDGKGFKLVIDPKIEPIIREIARKVLAGESLGSVAKWLNQSNTPTSRDVQRIRDGKKPIGYSWQVGNIAKLLRGKKLLGYMEKDDGTPIVNESGVRVRRADPILSHAEWEEIQQRLDSKAKSHLKNNWGNKHRVNGTMLLQVAFCLTCKRPLYTANGRSTRYYRCSSKPVTGIACAGYKGIRHELLEEMTSRLFLSHVGDLEVMRKVFVAGEDHTEEINETADAIRRLTVQLERLPEGGVAAEHALERIAEHELNLVQLRSLPQRDAKWRFEPTGQTFHELWNSLNDWSTRGRLLRDSKVRVEWSSEGARIDLGDLADLVERAQASARGILAND